MIKVNLLPQGLRRQKSGTMRVPYAPLAILAGVLFLLMTFFFYADFLKVRSAHSRVRKEWLRLSPKLGELKKLENLIQVEMKNEKDFLEKNVLNTDPVTRIMTWASEFLPSRGWLTELVIEREGEGCRIILKGVVLPSRSQTGIEQVEEYLRTIKSKLPPQATMTLTTSQAAVDEIEGTAFASTLEWGVIRKP